MHVEIVGDRGLDLVEELPEFDGPMQGIEGGMRETGGANVSLVWRFLLARFRSLHTKEIPGECPEKCSRRPCDPSVQTGHRGLTAVAGSCRLGVVSPRQTTGYTQRSM